MCRLCCSWALWTVRQGAPLVSATETHCSAVQSMAPVRVLLPYPINPKQNQKKGPTTTQPKTERLPRPEKQKQSEGGGNHKGRGPQHQNSMIDRKTIDQRQRGTSSRTQVQESKGRRHRRKEGRAEGAEPNTDTGTPHTQTGGKKTGGSNGQEEKGHARTREGTRVPYWTSNRGPGTSKMNTSVRQRRATLKRSKVV